MALKILDSMGLKYVLSKIKTLLSGKADKEHTHLYAGSSTAGGVATSASKLATARTISLSGDATGSNTFDGSADKSIAVTLANSGVTAGNYGLSANATPAHSGTFNVPYITVDAKGRVTGASTKTVTLPASYSLPNATSSVLGGVKVGTNISVSSGTISVANGTTSAKGVVQLTDSISSTSTTTAATPNSVKSAYDLAKSKQSPATTLAGYGITNAYSKTEIDTLINNLQAKITELESKIPSGTLATVATTGSYKDLKDLPTRLNEVKDY